MNERLDFSTHRLTFRALRGKMIVKSVASADVAGTCNVDLKGEMTSLIG
jgi:hypothetical protein